MRARILTPWTGAGTTANPNRPLVADLYPLLSWVDATGQPAAELPPDPNLLAIEAQLMQGVLASIEADTRFYVLWSEE